LRRDTQPLVTTLVLLSILIAMVSMVIGDSVARAFSLVGALSIVRFRTVVDDTRDTAFVIFAVIVGMAAGAGLIWLAVVGIPIVAVAAIFLRQVQTNQQGKGNFEHSLHLRMGLGRDPDALLAEIFSQHLAGQRLVATTTARQGAALDLNYLVQLRSPDAMAAFVTKLNQVEGVQSVELRAV
jgi:uncharacterized membrane protein YhiD involved in acid resistance